MELRIAPAGLALILFVPSLCQATGRSKLPIAEGTCYSPNKEFMVVANAKTSQCEVFAVANPDVPLWSFSYVPGPGTFLVADDGRTVVDLTLPKEDFVHARKLGDADSVCLQIWVMGKNVKWYRLSQLCGRTRTIGNAGLFQWNDWYTRAGLDGDELKVETIDGGRYRISLKTGAILAHQSREEREEDAFEYINKVALGTGIVLGVALFVLCCFLPWRRYKGRRLN